MIRAVLEEAAQHSSISFFHWEPHVHSTPRAPRSRGLHSRTEPRRRPRRLDRRPRGGRAGRHPRTRWTRSKRSTGPSSRRHLLEIVARARPAEKSNGRCTGKFRLSRRFDENTISPCRQPEACPILHPRDSVPDRSELYLLNRAPFSTNSGACQPRRTTGLRHCLHSMRRNLIGEHTK